MTDSGYGIRKFGIRGKIILTMVASLTALMCFVGVFVFFQVAEQMHSWLQNMGDSFTKTYKSANRYWLQFEDKKELMKSLTDIVDHPDVMYAILAKMAKDGATPDGDHGMIVFAAKFSQENNPMRIEDLINLHLSQKERVVDRDDFLGFTEVIPPNLAAGGDLQNALMEAATETEFSGSGEEDELLMLESQGEGDDDLVVAPIQADNNSPTPIKKDINTDKSDEGIWGYVLLGLSTAQLHEQRAKLLRTLLIVLCVALVLFSLFVYLGSNKIYGRILLMMDLAKRMSEGDLSETLPEFDPDEIGMLTNALNRITGNLNDMILKITQVTSGLGDAVEQITAATEEVVQGAEYQVASVDETSSSMSQMVISLKGVAENVEVLASSAEESSSSIMEMAATNDEVADNISGLMNSVEETTTSIEQMTRAVKEVAKNVEDLSTTAEQTSTSMRQMDVSIGQVETNANETATLSEEVRGDAERGSDAVRKTIEGISQISESTRHAFYAIEALSKKIQAIGQVLTVIDDVAEQTNLLALNAAIIAAQAGEHGKGFAVVADEIKDLAERTAASTNEISELILAVQSETKNVIRSMEQSRDAVDQGVVLSSEAENALRKILESSTKSTSMVREIARATVEQARGSKLVTDAMSRIAETVQQIASATSEQARGSEQIMNSAERMKFITQHVHSSSQEQARGSKQVTKAMENISEMVHHLNRAQKEQTRGSEQVMHAVEKIKEVAEHHSDAMGNMKRIVDQVAEQADTLRSAVTRFKL